MKNILLFTLAFFLFAEAYAQEEETMACDQEKIFKLLVEKGLLDMGESKVCVDMTTFPAIQLNLHEANYDLNGSRVQGGSEKQDAQVAKLHEFFNSVLSDGEKLGIYTRGYADGVNGSEDHDARITSELLSNGKLDLKKLENVIKPMDSKGYEAIVAELKKKNLTSPSLNTIKTHARLTSLLRNSLLAKSRGENICSILKKDPSECQNEGEISPTLDQGKTCFDGCCDGRRGAFVKFTLPDQVMKSEETKGKWQPAFEMAQGNFSKKLQFASSFSVLDLDIPENKKLEKAFLIDGEAGTNLIEEDRKRFREALQKTGCETNDLIVDAARRIWWKIKNSRRFISEEVRTSIDQKDFDKAFDRLSISTDNVEKDLYKMMIAGGVGRSSRANTTDYECADMIPVDVSGSSENMEGKEFKKCQVVSEDNELSQFKNVYDLMKSDLVKADEVRVLASKDKNSPGVFFVFDTRTGEKKQFSYTGCEEYIPSVKSIKNKGTWGSTGGTKKFMTSCMHSDVQSYFKDLDDNFFEQSIKSSGGRPTDQLNCLSVAKAYNSEFKNAPEGETAKATMKPFCEVQKDNQVTLEFDYHRVNTVLGKHGFICKMCGSGVRYDLTSKKFTYKPREPRKNSSGEDLSKLSFDQTLNNQTTMMTYGANKHPRTFLIPNCGSSCEDACACLKGGDIDQLLKDAEVVDFTDLSTTTEFPLKKYKGDGSGSYACFFTPKVPNTCGVAPDGSSCSGEGVDKTTEVKCKLQVELEKLPYVRAAPTSDEVSAYKNTCFQSPFPASEEACQISTSPICTKILDQHPQCRSKNKGTNSSGAVIK